MLPAAGARRSAYVLVASRGCGEESGVATVEMDHHLTSPTSRESLARTHARTHAQAHRSRTGERIDVLLPPRPGRPRGACAGRARATSHRRKALNGATTEEERRAT